ncbi:hypothetical protein CVT26_006424 [Gymnopilus dilepis]|uniref:Uncharacterized protein n=1 Tax=Gymnopilus dilepis TaxID=231916 RepID=A0A409Y1T8_9AGAR|nr:hypothetical protein CVT26_006424 [Gymnopilus dilepis]
MFEEYLKPDDSTSWGALTSIKYTLLLFDAALRIPIDQLKTDLDCSIFISSARSRLEGATFLAAILLSYSGNLGVVSERVLSQLEGPGLTIVPRTRTNAWTFAWSFSVLGITRICNLKFKGAEVPMGAYILALGFFQVVIGHIGIFTWTPVNAVEALGEPRETHADNDWMDENLTASCSPALAWQGIMVITYALLLIVHGSSSNSDSDTAERRKFEDKKKAEAIFFVMWAMTEGLLMLMIGFGGVKARDGRKIAVQVRKALIMAGAIVSGVDAYPHQGHGGGDG